MAKTSFIDIDPSEEDLFYKNLTPADRFIFGSLRHVKIVQSRRRKKGVSQRSLLPHIAELWANLSEEEKTNWSLAGSESSMNGWRAFVADMSKRIINDIEGVATPSIYHQDLVGYLIIENPATHIKIAQYHPSVYWVRKKIKGTKNMYEPVQVVEDFALPLTLSINYKSNLYSPYVGEQGLGLYELGNYHFGDNGQYYISAGLGLYELGNYHFGDNTYPLLARAKFYAEVWSSYQGVDRFTWCEIPFDFSTDWKNATATISEVIGHVIGYTLYIEIYYLQGLLLLDNIKATHSGQNWVRDTKCKDLYQPFTKAYYQVPKHWVPIELPVGSEFGSLYPN